MKIINNTSNFLKNILDKKYIEVKTTSKVLLVRNKELSNELLDTNNNIVPKLSELSSKGDYILIDLFSDLKFITRINNLFIDNLEKLRQVYEKKKEIVDPLNFNDTFIKEYLRIYLNNLARKYHNKKIILLFSHINTSNKLINNDLVPLNETEVVQVNKLNEFLDKERNLIEKKIIPDITILNIEKDIFIKDFTTRELVVIDKEILKINFKSIGKEIFNGEKNFSSVANIRYIFEEAKLFNKDRLVVIFAAFSKEEAKYNYIKSLKTIDTNKLFILDDYGTKGTYYLGLDGNFEIESSVVSLITSIMSKKQIHFKDIIACGSSKGGSAALYYGFKYNFGNMIVGAPQYRIGTYLCNLSIKDYAHETFGDIQIENTLHYDNIIRLVANPYSKIHLLTGEGDNQYKRYLKDFLELADEYKLNLTLDMIEIDGHNDIAKEFPTYLNMHLAEILKGCNFTNIAKFINKFKN